MAIDQIRRRSARATIPRLRPRQIRQRRFEVLEDRAMLSAGVREEYMLELVNRFRTDPAGELTRLLNTTDTSVITAMKYFGVDPNVMAQQWATLTPAPPLEYNDILSGTALAHSALMSADDQQSHQLPGEPDLGTRISDAGYSFSSAGENIYAYATETYDAFAAFAIDWGYGAGGMESPPGHRLNMMNAPYRDVGFGILDGGGSGKSTGPLLVTQDFGTPQQVANPFLVGAVFTGTDANSFYSLSGEGTTNLTSNGLSNVSVSAVAVSGAAQAYTTTTTAAGGYQLQLPAGTYAVTFSGGGLSADIVKTVTVANDNVLLNVDLYPGQASSPTSTVSSLPAIEATSSFPVSWSGSDAGGPGIASYDIFVSDDSGPFTPWLTATTQTTATYSGAFGHTYSFYSVASDNAGNRQPTPTAAQAATKLVQFLPGTPATVVVNTTADTDAVNASASPYDMSGNVSLRSAVEYLDASTHANGAGADRIEFNIPGAGTHTIQPTSALPVITDPVMIDGYSQPGSAPNTLAAGDNAALDIELDGANAGSGTFGLTLNAAGSTIEGLVINRFSGSGIFLSGASATGDVISGNFIGTDPTGTIAAGNAQRGVTAASGATNNVIGGTRPAARNVISGNGYEGIAFDGASDNVVEGNYIGTDSSGTVALGNGSGGMSSLGFALNGVILRIGATNNTIGGTAPGSGNLISGNAASGVGIYDSGTTGNHVEGNFIGSDVTGETALGNAQRGVTIAGPATGNIVGGTTAAARNIISGNGYEGVAFDGGSGNVVEGNYIGTDVAGATAVPNKLNGVILRAGASNNTVGGAQAGAGNVISGNAQSGVALFDAGTTGNVITGNLIGTDAAGSAHLPNVNGIGMASGASANMVGGTTTASANVISGNSLNGVLIEESGNTVEANLIGVAADGTTALGNGSHGVFITSGAGDNAIGGTITGTGNVIAFNAGDGVLVGTDEAQSATTAAGVGNTILSNYIYANRRVGIDLGPDDGVTPNGSLGFPAANNTYQPFPVITAVTPTSTSIEVSGRYSDPQEPNAIITLQFFASGTGDPSGYGQGQRFLGGSTVNTDSSGNASFDVTLPVGVPLGQTLTATATDPASGTSEFSAWVVVPPTAHQEYVTAVYHDVLARPPDSAGLAYWSGLLDTGTAISSVAEGIAHSDEYYANVVIKPDYLKLLNRAADASGVTYWTDQMEAGLTDQQLEAELVSSQEFYKNAGGTNRDWIDAVYKLLLGRMSDAQGESYWMSQLAAGQTLNAVAQAIAGSQENDTQLIDDDYFHYLGRAADPQGLSFWLQQLADGKTNEDIIAGFTGASEYYKEHTS